MTGEEKLLYAAGFYEQKKGKNRSQQNEQAENNPIQQPQRRWKREETRGSISPDQSSEKEGEKECTAGSSIDKMGKVKGKEDNLEGSIKVGFERFSSDDMRISIVLDLDRSAYSTAQITVLATNTSTAELGQIVNDLRILLQGFDLV